MGISPSCGPTQEEVKLMADMEQFRKRVKVTEELLAKIGVPALSERIFCKNSELNLFNRSEATTCQVEFDDEDALGIYADQCIKFYNSLLENKDIQVMSTTNFDAFINGGRLWYLFNTHYSRCMFPPNEKALTIIKQVLEIWHLVLITVYRFYYHGSSNGTLPPKRTPYSYQMNAKQVPVVVPVITINLPKPLTPEPNELQKEPEKSLI